MTDKEYQRLRARAWVGDSVLELFVRQRLIQIFHGNLRSIPPESIFLSNKTLQAFSGNDATEFEAWIFRVYKRGAIDEVMLIVDNLIDFGLEHSGWNKLYIPAWEAP